jgi:acyl-CoA reductase-like NAD-dependent aldehyde dehydrogenase
MMNLPNYFLADLPPEAELNASLISEACQTLKRNRSQYLETRSTSQIVRMLDKVGREWLEPESPFRRMALQEGPAATGFSREALAHGLDLFFAQLTIENLEGLIRQELGHLQRLDGFHAGADEMSDRRVAWARGPQLVAQIAPGNIPSATLAQMVLGVLARSAQFVKCASGQTFLPRLFAHSLYEAEAKLGACLEVAEWKGGAENLEAALFAESDCIVVTGSDETLADVRRRAPASARLIGYGTRVSFGYISRQALDRNSRIVAQQAAHAIAAWDQRGCLSPHDIYVEASELVKAEGFAGELAEELAALEKTRPRGTLPPRDAAGIANRRAFYEVRAAHSLETKMWASPESTAWTVILEYDPRFQASCQNRFIYIKAAPNLETVLQGAEPIREQLSTVGLACGADEMAELARRFSRWGARRICPLGEMQNPPLAWRHDGRPALADLLTWCDWEK